MASRAAAPWLQSARPSDCFYLSFTHFSPLPPYTSEHLGLPPRHCSDNCLSPSAAKLTCFITCASLCCLADPLLQGPGPYPSEGKPLPSSFGHSYYFAVPDTVTSGTMGSAEGSMEFLAFQVSSELNVVQAKEPAHVGYADALGTSGWSPVHNFPLSRPRCPFRLVTTSALAQCAKDCSRPLSVLMCQCPKLAFATLN